MTIFTYHLIIRSYCVNLRKLVTIVIQPVTHGVCMLFSDFFMCSILEPLFDYYHFKSRACFLLPKIRNFAGVTGKRNVCQRSSLNSFK